MFHTPAHKVIPANVVVSSETGIVMVSADAAGAERAAAYANGMARKNGSTARYHAGFDCPAQRVNPVDVAAPQDDEWESPHLADLPGYQDFAPQYR